MTSTLKLATLFLMIVLILFFIFFSLSFKKTTEFENKSNFECGFNSKNKYNLSFSLNYFFLTIILVVFDLEMIIIFLSVNYELAAMKTLALVAFLGVFTALLSFEWFNSVLEWE